MKLWRVGQWKGHDKQWEWQGIFDSEEKAVNACRDGNYFVAPVILNEERPHETIFSDDLYYPKAGI